MHVLLRLCEYLDITCACNWIENDHHCVFGECIFYLCFLFFFKSWAHKLDKTTFNVFIWHFKIYIIKSKWNGLEWILWIKRILCIIEDDENIMNWMGTWMAIRWVVLAHGINHEMFKLSNPTLYHGVIKDIKLLLLATKKVKHIICTLAIGKH